MINKALLILPLFVLAACSHGNCGANHRKPSQAVQSGQDMAKTSTSERVKVYKPDGTLQCGQGAKIALADMKKELGSISVYSSENKNDGMMRIQKCGAATGNCNIFEIDRKNLDEAIKNGFKEWTAE